MPRNGRSTFLPKIRIMDDPALLTDRNYLTRVQYQTDGNLAARQSIYAYQRSGIDVATAVIDVASLGGHETVADIGCGNGRYLAELARRGHGGRLLGADLSAGMLRAARNAVMSATQREGQRAGLVAGDAAALPVADDVADVTLAPHMLYHVPDRPAAVREFRRITRPGGQVLVVLNATGHLAEFRDIVDCAAADIGVRVRGTWVEERTDAAGLNLDSGARLLAQVFGTVQRHDFVGELVVPGPPPVLDYVASMRSTQLLARPAELVEAVAARLPDGQLTIRTHCGVLACR